MHDHDEILALAAASIDFELEPAERSQLESALETCSLCRRQAAAMRATATVLRRPSDFGTPGRVRDVVIGAAIGGGRRTPAFRSLLAASLSLLVVLGGTVAVVGNRGLNILPSASPSASAPIQTATALASPTASPAASPASPSPTTQPSIVSPAPTQTSPAISPSPENLGPLGTGEIAAMVSSGRLVIRTKPGTGADSAIFKTGLYPGQRVLTLEGPVEASGYPWFRVRLGVIEGWAAAASRDGEPWLAPVRNGLIAFVRDAADGSGEAIYTVGPDGTAGEAVMLAEPSLCCYEQLTWSPDGRRLAFVGLLPTPTEIDTPPAIFVIDADGSNLVQITQSDTFADSPAWSPDGSRLAFRQARPNPVTDSTVVVTNADGSGLRVLGPGENPAWSPDGQQLAMTVTDGDSTRLWVQAADGGERRQVSDASVVPERPAWSPDGQYLLVSSSGLVLVEVESGSITPLIGEPGSMPTWSMSGAIAFSATGSASPTVFLVDSDGSNLRRVSGDVGFAAVPRWSPDGRWLLLGDEDGGSPVAIVDLSTGSLTLLGSEVGVARSPAWQPRLP